VSFAETQPAKVGCTSQTHRPEPATNQDHERVLGKSINPACRRQGQRLPATHRAANNPNDVSRT